jgi:hypothetical protein
MGSPIGGGGVEEHGKGQEAAQEPVRALRLLAQIAGDKSIRLNKDLVAEGRTAIGKARARRGHEPRFACEVRCG